MGKQWTSATKFHEEFQEKQQVVTRACFRKAHIRLHTKGVLMEWDKWKSRVLSDLVVGFIDR